MSEYLPLMRTFHPRAPRFSQEEKERPQLLASAEVSSLRSRLHPNGTTGTKSFKPITKQLSTTQPWATDLAKLFKAARKDHRSDSRKFPNFRPGARSGGGEVFGGNPILS